jgi:hypothetical protein
MNWLIALLVSVLTPVLQPVVQTSVERVRDRVQARVQQLQQSQPAANVVYHEGRWWRFENGQWYVWTENTAVTAEKPVYWNDGQQWWCQIGDKRYVWNGSNNLQR